VVGADHLAQFFRVEPRRKRRRADQIAEHHGQLRALGIGGSRGIRDRRPHRGGGRRAAERSDGVQQLAPMADRGNADLPEILRCKPRQHLPIDLVVAEGRHIALKARTLQPRLDVHAVILGSEERHLHLFEDIDLPVELPAAALK
jgi:hypothetical protein